MFKIKLIAVAIIMSLVAPLTIANEAPPKLILQITIDALRGDLPSRYRNNMGEGGFTYLLDQGVHFTNAHYQHSNTETIVGHVALATGAPPAVNGMVGNVWYDRSMNRAVYNIEDPNHRELPSGSSNNASIQLDDTQNTAQVNGRSPVNINSSTLADEIIKASNGQSRAFAVSYKDRGAVPLAGELGKAFWFSNSTGGFITSDYYYDSYPKWVSQWNESAYIERYSNQQWQLMYDRDKYMFAKEGDVDYKVKIGTFKRSFPYSYGPSDNAYFTTMLSLSPASDEIVSHFSQTLLKKEKLGQSDHTDFLAVSFSANDYIIHVNGPSSLEAEDGLLHLDRTLAQLFKAVDEQVGLNNTLIILSADHGTPDVPAYTANLGRTTTNIFDAKALFNAGLFEKTQKQFGIGSELYLTFENPNLYLNHEVIADKGLKLADVQRFIAKELAMIKGIDSAYAGADIITGNIPNTRIAQLVQNNYFPNRSGDIYVVFHPGVYINAFDSLTVAAVHGSPWRYDTHVPVIFAGYGLESLKSYREVSPYDVAPTVSAILNIPFPNGSTGKVLKEVISK